LVAALFFAHVTSIDSGGRGIGSHLRSRGETSVAPVSFRHLRRFASALRCRRGVHRVRFC
jgi:hypothetical protein